MPTAITSLLIAPSGSSFHTGEFTLGTPTCSARSRHGRWALYPDGDQVVVVWPGGTLSGRPGEVARELDRLDVGQDDLDHAAALAIRRFLTDPAAQDGAAWSSTRARTWSIPAVGYWLSGRFNQPGYGDRTSANRPGAPAPASPITLPPPSPRPAPTPKPARAA